MAITVLYKQKKNAQSGSYKDGTHFKLNNDERALDDAMPEEICLSTGFLSLSSNKFHYTSKQELKNNLIKGDNKYPCIIANTIVFFQYNNLRNKATHLNDRHMDIQYDALFAQDGVNVGDIHKPLLNVICRGFEDSACEYKKRHTWKEYLSNQLGINKGKLCTKKGKLVLCTVSKFEESLEFTDKAIVNQSINDIKDQLDDSD